MPLTTDELIDRGMATARYAADAPDRMAVISQYGERTFRELNDRTNRLARGLRALGARSARPHRPGAGRDDALHVRNDGTTEGCAPRDRDGARALPAPFAQLTPCRRHEPFAGDGSAVSRGTTVDLVDRTARRRARAR